MTATQARVIGSGYTTLHWQGQPIAWLISFQDAGQVPISQGMEAITPLDAQHPTEIVTSRVVKAGTINAVIQEVWNIPVWEQLAGLEDVGDTITDIYTRIAASPSEITCQLSIINPQTNVVRGKIYHGCKIFQIDDSEDVQIGTMGATKAVQIAYTHKTPFTANV